MGIPTIFIIFVIFVAVFRYNMAKNTNDEKKVNEEFWDRENDSHYIRKKEITDADLINSYGDELPHIAENYYEAHNIKMLYTYQETCHKLKDQPMMNLGGMLNSEVRMMYGTSQIDTIESYENTYLQYQNALFAWAKGLSEKDMTQEAIQLLEISQKTGTDISYHFILLGDLYHKNNETKKLNTLIKYVKTSDFTMKSKILKSLRESAAAISR